MGTLSDAFVRMVDTAQEVAMWVFVGLVAIGATFVWENPNPHPAHVELVKVLAMYAVALVFGVSGIKGGKEVVSMLVTKATSDRANGKLPES